MFLNRNVAAAIRKAEGKAARAASDTCHKIQTHLSFSRQQHTLNGKKPLI